MRHEDSVNLFGRGSGISTYGEIVCDVCKRVYHKGADEEDQTYEYYDYEPVANTVFAGLTVCECCYETIEKAVLSRIDDILTWYQRILLQRRKVVDNHQALLQNLIKGE